MVFPAQAPILHRHSCAECQRRKQKCNREWPCNHCQKRRVVDKCRFGNSIPQVEKPASSLAGQKRSQPFEGDDAESDDDSDSDGPGLEALGYMDGPLLASLSIKADSPGKAVQEMHWAIPEEGSPIQQALDALPPRAKMDSLVQLFFDNVNYHYYIIFPATFLQEYQEWWDRRVRKQPLSVQWTSLLLTICSCATQHLHLDDKPQLESDFGESVDVLTERYLFAARELSNSIPDGHYHFLNVQRLLHAIYWYKSEARFVEAWHLIGAAVREAQELGLPRDSTSQGLPDFDREMRRRVWCVLSTWDWQFASGLGRPTIIDHRNVEVAQPTLSIEGYNPSPLLHMKLQAESVAILAAKFGAPRNIASTHDIREYTQTLEDWMCTFPAVYSMEDPDHSPDASHPWAVSHRYYIHTMACLMVLNPVRSYMARSYSDTSTEDELWIRKNGVHYALKNLRTTSAWTHHAHQNDGRFHFIIFSLFDTASVLSAAILKDDNYSLPQRAKVLAAIEEAVVLLGRINNLSKTASTSYRLIINIVKRVPGLRYYMRRKRVKVESPGGAVPHLALHDKPGSNGSNAGSRTTSKPNLDNGFETASPSNHYTNGSGTTDTTPSSLTVATPNTDSPNLTPTVHERPISAFSADNYLAFHHEGEPDHDLNAGLQPSFPPLGEAHERLAGMNPYTELQQLEPTDEDNENTPPITDAELGEFSRLWDWGSLNFGFIVSESAPLPMAPDADQS